MIYMKHHRTRTAVRLFIKFWSWTLGTVLLSILFSSACGAMPGNPQEHQVFTEGSSLQILDPAHILENIADANVVYLGEVHDRPADHEAQLEIIRALYPLNPNLVIAMEMFQRPYQEVIDAYLAGDLSAAELRQQSEYDQRWGFPWEYYAPILEFAQTNQLPVIALNTPTEITRTVAREGLDGLQDSDRQWIPPESEIRTDNEQYRHMLRDIYDQAHHGHGSSASFENFFLAQVLWDETMAERIADAVQNKPDHQIIVLAGQGHIVYGYGIPSRVERRLRDMDEFVQRSLLLTPSPDRIAPILDDQGTPIADYFWDTTRKIVN
jgi:uncharacterized iron-regulated protein